MTYLEADESPLLFGWSDVYAALSDLHWAVYLILALIIVAIIEVIRRFISGLDRTITALIHPKRPDERRDPVRLYTASQKREGLEICQERCEGTGVILRCRHRGTDLQGDHWFPHARGGSTTVKNLVMLCPKCNRRKSAHIPSRGQTWALKRRRRSYAPPDRIKVGEWRPRRQELPPAREWEPQSDF